MEPSPAKPNDSKPRKIKPLPPLIATLTWKDYHKFAIVLENDPNPKSPTYCEEFRVATKITFNDANEAEGQVFNIQDLNIDQIRRLCRNIRVANVGSMNKFHCRRAIASRIDNTKLSGSRRFIPPSQASQITSTICRAVNVVFSNQFIEDFLKINDRKKPSDHQSLTTFEEFWIRATASHNGCIPSIRGDVIGVVDNTNFASKDEDDTFLGNKQVGSTEFKNTNKRKIIEEQAEEDAFSKLIYPPGDVHLSTLENNPNVNLMFVDRLSPDAFCTNIGILFKIRHSIKDTMQKSRAEDKDPWNFVNAAMEKSTRMTKVAVYYFYMRCEHTPDLDSGFMPYLDKSLIPPSIAVGETASNGTDTCQNCARKKMKLEESLTEIATFLKSLMEYMKDIAEKHDLKEKRMEEKEVKKQQLEKEKEEKQSKKDEEEKKFARRLALAKALGDRDMLKKLAETEDGN